MKKVLIMFLGVLIANVCLAKDNRVRWITPQPDCDAFSVQLSMRKNFSDEMSCVDWVQKSEADLQAKGARIFTSFCTLSENGQAQGAVVFY